MRKLFISIALVSFSSVLVAAQLIQPGRITDDQLKQVQCVQLHKDRCVNNFCVVNSPISSERNCPEICEKKAKEVCEKNQ